MAINVNVQYNGGLLPGIILLTQCYYYWGTRLNAMKMFGLFPLTGGCSEGLDAFRFFFKQIHEAAHRRKAGAGNG